MPLVRQRTHVGRKRGPKKRPRIPYYKNRKFRKNRVKQNAIFKETKTRTDEQVQSLFGHGGGYFNQVPTTFHPWPHAGDKVFPLKLYCVDSQVQGIDDDMLSGQSLFAKYLKMKIQLKFPESVSVPQDQPDMYIVHGFIKTSPNLNGVNTVQGVTDPTQWSTQNDWDWIRSELEPYFDEREDKLRYIPKRNSNLNILGYHRIKPQQREGWGRVRTTAYQWPSGEDPAQIRTIGTLRDYHRTLRWPMMKKLHYEVGLTGTFTPGGAVVRNNNCFINMNQWRPFACLYCPQMGTNGGVNPPLTVANLPEVAYNGILYYTDS